MLSHRHIIQETTMQYNSGKKIKYMCDSQFLFLAHELNDFYITPISVCQKGDIKGMHKTFSLKHAWISS